MKRKASCEDKPPPAKKAKHETGRRDSVSTPTTTNSLSTPKAGKVGVNFSCSTPTAVTASSPLPTPIQVKRTKKNATPTSTPVSKKGPTSTPVLKNGPTSTPVSKNTPLSTPVSKIKGILKADSASKNAGNSSPSRNVSFEPEQAIITTLEKMKTKAATASEVNALLSHLANNKGRGLVLCLEEMRRFVGCFDREHFSVIEDILKIHWTSHEEAVFSAFQKFILALVSHHHFYAKSVIRSFLRQFMPHVEDGVVKIPNSPYINRNIHAFFKKFLKKFSAEKKDLMKQGSNLFPYFKQTSDRFVGYIRGWLEMYSYVTERRSDILEIAFEKLIQLDAGLNRDHIRGYVNEINRENKEKEKEKEENKANGEDAVNGEEEDDDDDDDEKEQPLDMMHKRLCENIDHVIREIFKFLRQQAFDTVEEKDEDTDPVEENEAKEMESVRKGDHEMTENIVYNPDKAKELEIILLKLFKSHLLTSNRLLHVQFPIFYLASHSSKMSKKFLELNWEVFSDVTQASILRQAAVTYLAGFICRSVIVSVKSTRKWVKKITKWIHSYISGDASHDVDYMVVNLAAHGHFYSACQALFYIIAFRHRDLVVDEDVSFLRSLELNSVISHALNPLRVISPPVLKVFTKVVGFYQISYCNNVIQRNKRITLPVVGLSSGSQMKGKALMLDDYFPFDPYLLPVSRHLIDPLYRVYVPLDDDSDSESDDEVGEEDQDQDFDYVLEDHDTEEKMLDSYSRRRRTVSTSSNSSRRSRTNSLSETIAKSLLEGI